MFDGTRLIRVTRSSVSEMCASALRRELIRQLRRKKLIRSAAEREAFEVLAARILLAYEQTQETIIPRRVRTGIRKIDSLGKELDQIRTMCDTRVKLPSEEEARYWLKQWREGAMHQRMAKESS